MNSTKKRGINIDVKIIDFIKKQIHPISTREIAITLNLSWHTAINHCLRLQLSKKIEGYKIGNINVWSLNHEKN